MCHVKMERENLNAKITIEPLPEGLKGSQLANLKDAIQRGYTNMLNHRSDVCIYIYTSLVDVEVY